jgi:spermidine/putrescine transport system permease protein
MVWLSFRDELLMNALRWTFYLAVTTLITVPMAMLAAKLYKHSPEKLLLVF